MAFQQVLTGMFPSPFHFEAVDFNGNGKLDTGEPNHDIKNDFWSIVGHINY